MEQLRNIKNILLAAFALAGGTILELLGGWSVSLQALLILMSVDYITGVLIAGVYKKSTKSADGALESKAGFKGLIKKGAMLLLILAATQLDLVLGGAYAHTTLILFFIGNEGLSVLENLGIMGVPYPTFLKNMLEVLREKNDPDVPK